MMPSQSASERGPGHSAAPAPSGHNTMAAPATPMAMRSQASTVRRSPSSTRASKAAQIGIR